MGGPRQGRRELTPTLPSSGQIALWLIFRPLTLREALLASGVTQPLGRVGSYWAAGGAPATYATRMTAVVLLWGPLLTLLLAALLARAGAPLRPALVILGIGVAWIAALLVMLLVDLGVGVLIGLTGCWGSVVGLGLYFGGAFGPRRGLMAAVAFGLVHGCVAGFTFGSIVPLRWGRVMSFGRAQFATAALSLLWFGLWGFQGGAGPAGAKAASALVALLLGLTRLPLYPAECIWEWTLLLAEHVTGRSTLGWAPIFLQEVGYLPHPGLRSHILRTLRLKPEQGCRALVRCLAFPAQATWAASILENLAVTNPPPDGTPDSMG